MPKILRIVTIPISFQMLISGQVRFMQSKGFTVIMASADDDNDGTIERIKTHEQAPFHRLPLTRSITPLTDLNALWETIRLIRQFQPDIVHTHTPKAGLIGMLAAWLTGVPVRLHTVAGLPLMERKGLVKRLLINLEWLTYACATGVYPNSNVLLRYIEQHIYRHPKLRVMGHGSSNGIDTQRFKRTPELEAKAQALRRQLGLAPDTFVWVFIGRIVTDKGINELIDAFCRLADQHGPMHLLLVGPYETDINPLPARTQHQIETRPDITHIGFQQDVRPYFIAANALAFPSYREGFPNVPLQAACLELPIIVTDINGCNEIIQDGENGLLVPPKDTAALYEAMLRLWQNPALRNELRHRSHRMISERYEQTWLWAQWVLEYNKLLAAQGRPGVPAVTLEKAQ